ncbi:hypothetical protein NMY22_g12976 [Coprinellus aureogranulatus]|nr:hypothetical protein NMY22_g12976 [Coprinellus aureogranulatus]
MAPPLSHLDLRSGHMKQVLYYYRHLPDEFLPSEIMEPPEVITPGVTKEEWTKEAWRAYLCKTFPRSHIPTKLALKSGVNFQPPRFIFGWAMEYSVLKTIAERCGFARHLIPLDLHKLAEDLTSVVRSQCPQVVEQFGWSFIARVLVHDKGILYCIAVADSWMTGNNKPTAEQINTLREFFGIGKGNVIALADNEAMWWTELDSTQWHYRHKWEDLKEHRPWDLERSIAKLDARRQGTREDSDGTDRERI